MKSRFWKVFLFTSPFFMAWFVYLPGLSGGFHFDDVPNLSKLGDFGAVDNFGSLFAYLKSGMGGPTGRPISLLSFLIDGQTWPTDPADFLRTNILLHGLNGALLAVVFYLLLRSATNSRLRQNAHWIAFVAAGIWVLHPFLVSTTLYIVQRMAMLSAFFTFSSIAIYLWARGRIASGKGGGLSYGTILIGLPIMVLLGVLSKENAALAPLLILVIEYFGVRPLWRTSASGATLTVLQGGVVWLPSLFVLAYLLKRAVGLDWDSIAGNREFTPYERLLTQARALWDYLGNLALPRPGYEGLYQDGFEVSAGLFSPLTTLVAVLGIVGLVVLIIWARRRAPLLALGLAFFLVGHVLESSVIMLEQVFEHRNYLPASFLALALAGAIFAIPRPVLRKVVALGLLIVLGGFTHNYAQLWGQPIALSVYWAERNPHSVRAQIVAAEKLLERGESEWALKLLQDANNDIQDSAALLTMQLSAAFASGLPYEETMRRTLEAFRSGPFDRQLPKISEALVDNFLSGSRAALPAEFISDALEAMIVRPRYKDRPYQLVLRVNRARLNLALGETESACSDLRYILERSKSVDSALRVMQLLANNGYYRSAQSALRLADARLRHKTFPRTMPASWYESEVNRLRSVLEDDLETAENQEMLGAPICSFTFESHKSGEIFGGGLRAAVAR